MHVQLILESPHQVWTNLDFIRGKVVLRLPSVTPIVSILVKLEGESRTRLLIQQGYDRQDRPRPVEEVHKLLYNTATVFPPETVKAVNVSQKHYTLGIGQYEYFFEFKLPFNNICSTTNPLLNASFQGLSLGAITRPPSRHIKTTLPPTLTAFPGVAEIRYYLKVTVNRKEFYKENPRVVQNFNFLPIEPPRPQSTGSEVYARRHHQFPSDSNAPGASKIKSLFGPARKPDVTRELEPPKISLDARLPNPAILTCNEDIPLRLLVRRLNSSTEQLHLHTLQIELIGHTHIRAHEAMRNETNTWLVLSLAGLDQPLETVRSEGAFGKVEHEFGEEIVIDSNLWSRRPLPNSVAPSFDTCNISRNYDLDIRVGIGHGLQSKHKLIVLPLRLPVVVFSGIHPPDALLASLQYPSGKIGTGSTPLGRKPVGTAQPSPPLAGPSSQPLPPTQPAYAPLPAGDDQGQEDPPPSYEDAVGVNLPPVAGPRRDYNPPPVPEGASGFERDEKGRRGS